jgi:hypothetical protein
MAIIRAKTSFVVIAPGFCHLCDAGNVLAAIMAPAGYRYCDRSVMSWKTSADPSILSNIESLNDEAVNFMSQIDPHWRMGTSETSGTSFYMNHCHKCGRPQDDSFLQKLDGPFLPIADEEINDIQIKALDLPIVAIGQYSNNFLYNSLLDGTHKSPGAPEISSRFTLRSIKRDV